MGKKQLTVQEKQLDVDLWIIVLVTFGVFMVSAVVGVLWSSFFVTLVTKK